jgi:hypothetical protein
MLTNNINQDNNIIDGTNTNTINQDNVIVTGTNTVSGSHLRIRIGSNSGIGINMNSNSNVNNDGGINNTTVINSGSGMTTIGIKLPSMAEISIDSDGVKGLGIMHQLSPIIQYGRFYGLKALVDIKQGTCLGRYVGEIITRQADMLRRMNEEGPKYIAELIPGRRWICGKYRGNILKLMNHNCIDYNCQLLTFTEDDGTESLGIWTIKDVADNEPLFFKYIDRDGQQHNSPIKCLCRGTYPDGSSICNTEL